MVYLNRIYTKSGDRGETSLGTGRRVMKTSPRIRAYGTVDELNATLALVLSSPGLLEELKPLLIHIQNDLFDLGADLCVPHADPDAPAVCLRVVPEQVAQLEQWIDQWNEPLAPLTSFILPGGTPSAGTLHLARTVCRRAEIEVLELSALEEVNSQVTIYLNRLSDLLFVLSRVANDHGRNDVLWVPGASRKQVQATTPPQP